LDVNIKLLQNYKDIAMKETHSSNIIRPRDKRLPFLLSTVGEAIRQGPITREVGREWNQIIWIKKNSGIFTVDGHSYKLEAGQGMLMRHGYPHSYHGKDMHTGWCTFFCDESLLNYTIGDRSHIVFTVPASLEQDTAELARLARSNCSTLALSAAGYTYVTELLYAVTRDSDDVVDATRNYLKNNLTRDVSLDEIAAHIGMSKYALCHYFKQHRGCSVMEEFKQLRISHAKRLLRYSSESVEEIGKLCGYENHSYFSMRFREICGCSPSEYRKKHL
jgi:AraC-like DNA-binding protein